MLETVRLLDLPGIRWAPAPSDLDACREAAELPETLAHLLEAADGLVALDGGSTSVEPGPPSRGTISARSGRVHALVERYGSVQAEDIPFAANCMAVRLAAVPALEGLEFLASFAKRIAGLPDGTHVKISVKP